MLPQTQIAQARQADLLRLIEPDTTLIRIANTHGGEYAGPCPFCGGADRFHVVPEEGKWYCGQCTPRGGDAIDYVQRREQVAFEAAVDLVLGGTAGAAAGADAHADASAPRHATGLAAELEQPAWHLRGAGAGAGS